MFIDCIYFLYVLSLFLSEIIPFFSMLFSWVTGPIECHILNWPDCTLLVSFNFILHPPYSPWGLDTKTSLNVYFKNNFLLEYFTHWAVTSSQNLCNTHCDTFMDPNVNQCVQVRVYIWRCGRPLWPLYFMYF